MSIEVEIAAIAERLEANADPRILEIASALRQVLAKMSHDELIRGTNPVGGYEDRYRLIRKFCNVILGICLIGTGIIGAAEYNFCFSWLVLAGICELYYGSAS